MSIDDSDMPAASWRAHWCVVAQAVAAQKGWRLAETFGDTLVFEIADGHFEIIQFADAQDHAKAADTAAMAAIEDAVNRTVAYIEKSAAPVALVSGDA